MKQKQSQQPVFAPAFVAQIQHNNGGMWFKARSTVSADQLSRLFRNRKAGVILYERVGGIVQGIRKTLYIQIQTVTDVISGVDYESKEPIWRTVPSFSKGERPWPDWTVEVCLKELGVHLDTHVPLTEVLSALHGEPL